MISTKFKTAYIVIVLTFCLFPFIKSYGQNDEKNDSTITDTVPVFDTVSEVSAGPGESSQIEKENYFLDKSAYSTLEDSLRVRQLPPDVVKKMQGDGDYWYANADIEKPKQKETDDTYIPIGRRQWFQTLLWFLIIGGFAAFIMWYLAGSNVSLFRKKVKSIEEITAEDLETGDIFAINYQKQIDSAVKEGNYRLGVRLMFLQLLKNLSEKNIIHYKQDRTNFDYLLQLQPTIYYKDFFRITRNYEYSWYGHFDVNEETFRIISNDVRNFETQIKNR